MIDLNLNLLNVLSLCFESMYERLFTNVSVCFRFEIYSENNTSQIFKRMVGLVEMTATGKPCCCLWCSFMIISSKLSFV